MIDNILLLNLDSLQIRDQIFREIIVIINSLETNIIT